MEPVFVFEPWQDVLVLLARRYAVFAPKTRQRTVKETCQMMLKLIRFRVHTIATVSILGVGIFRSFGYPRCCDSSDAAVQTCQDLQAC